MSVKLIKVDNYYNYPLYKEFQLASAADLQDLPGLSKCSIGSIAYTQDLSHMWMLGEDDQWHEI